MKDLAEKIVRALVDSPEEVDVHEVEGSNMKILKIKVSERDLGALIGKKGRNISALRVIIAAASKGKRYYRVDVVEENRRDQYARDREID